MNWSRKGALLMLVVAVLWATTPAFACLLTAQSAQPPACCHGMMHHCGAMGASMSSPCCSARPQEIAVAPVPPFTPEHAQRLALLPHHAALLIVATASIAHGSSFDPPPLIFSSSGSTILRI